MTPVPISTPDGQISSYVVNAKVANPGQTRKVERAVEAAGGVVVAAGPDAGSDGPGWPDRKDQL